MKSMRVFLVALMAAAVVVSGCGKDEAPTVAPAGLKVSQIPNELGSLVPSDAIALVYIANPEAFETKLKGLVSQFDAEAADGIQLEGMGAEVLPGASQYWDRTKPCAIAVSMPDGGGDPMMALQGAAFIFPMTDVESARTGMEAQFKSAPEDQRPKVKTAGSYLAFCGRPDVVWGGSVPAIAKRVPAGDLALRIDLGALVTKFRPQIDDALGGIEQMMGAGLEQAPGQDAEALAGLFDGMAGIVKDFVNSAEMFELGVAIDGGVADLLVGFSAKKGSKLDIEHSDHGDLAALAAHLPDGFPAHILMRLEYGKIMQWVKPLMDSTFEKMPEDKRAKWQAYMDEGMEMSKLLGPNFAMAFAMTDNGMQMVEIANVTDGKAYSERMDKMVAVANDMPGFSISKGEGTMVAGVQVDAFDVKMDMKELMEAFGGDEMAGGVPPEAEEMFNKILPRLFGGETMRFHVAMVTNHLLFTMGNPANMEAMINSLRDGKGKMSPALQAAIKKAGGQPAFLMQAELRQLIAQIMKLAGSIAGEIAPGEEVPQVPAGAPIPVALWGAHEGRHYAGGLSIDVVGIAKLIESMDESENK